MSIGYRKISKMIEDEIGHVESLSSKEKEKLTLLCNKVYMLEASTDVISGARMIENIMGEIASTADRLREQGGKS